MKKRCMLSVATILFLPIFTCATNKLPEGFGVDFDEAMRPSKKYIPAFAWTKADWRILKQRYDEYIVNNRAYAKLPRIPKIIHQIWLGSPFPEKYKVFQETWKKHHPDWEYRLWTEKEVDEFGLTNRQLYDETPNYGAKSDIVRYEILYRIGGLYIDTDFECLRSFDVFNHCCDFYAGIAFDKDAVLFVGLIGSAPGHPVLKACIEDLCQAGKTHETAYEIMDRTGPYFFTRCFFKSIDQHEGPSVMFPVTYFYPWPHFERHQKTRKQILSWVRPETFGIHHWHVSWQKR